MEDLNAMPLLKTKRQQVSRACSNCRKAKTACSNQRPCQRCVKFNLQNSCEDAPRKQRANPDKKSKSPRRNASTSPNMMSSQQDDMEMDDSPNSEELNIAEIQYQQFMQPYQAPVYHTGQFLQTFTSQPANQNFNNFLPQYSPPFVPQQQFQFAPPFIQPPFQQNQFQQPQPPHQPQSHQQNQFQSFPFNQPHNNNHNNNIDINIQQSNALNQLQQTTFNIASSAMNSNEISQTFQEPAAKSGYTYPNPEECSLDKLQNIGGSSGNLSFGSAGSLTELMKMRTPSLESLIVTVNSEIRKKNKKEDSFSSIPI